MAAIDALSPVARHVLLDVLGCVVHADGEIDDDECGALHGASVALGADDHAPFRETDLEHLAIPPLGASETMLIYAAAAWMSLADGLVRRAESAALARLRRKLGLDEASARFLAAQARWVRASTDLPWHREFDLLLTSTAKRLAQVRAHRRAA